MEEVNKVKIFCSNPTEENLNNLKDYTIKFIKNAAEYSNLIKEGDLSLSRTVLRLINSQSLEIIEIDNTRDLQPYILTIKKYMKECFNSFDYSVFIGSWVIIKDNTGDILGFITVDSDNVIWNVCTTKKHRGKGAASKAIRHIIKKSCSQNKNTKLHLDKLGKHYKKLLKYYKRIGFKVISEKYLKTYVTMKFSCKSMQNQ
jgi:hypothetical protein